MKFGVFLKQQRENNDWRQPEAAEIIGIEQSYLSKLENGKAIPSPEIFDKLMTTYKFTVGDLGQLVQDSELEKLKDIVLVRDFIISHRKQHETVRRFWLIAGLISLMFGAAAMAYALKIHEQSTSQYLYESKGEIGNDESRFLYAEFPQFNEFNRRLPDKPEWKEHPLFERLDYTQDVTDQFLGEFYDLGNRRYHLVSTMRTESQETHFLAPSIGIMFIVGGIAAFAISRRW